MSGCYLWDIQRSKQLLDVYLAHAISASEYQESHSIRASRQLRHTYRHAHAVVVVVPDLVGA
eukprot:1581540-Rhodomonas_salina.4